MFPSIKKKGRHLILPSVLHDFFINNLVHDLEAFDGLLLCDANISLLQRHRTETANENKTSVRIHEVQQTQRCFCFETNLLSK